MPLLKYVWNCLPGEEPHKASLQANFLLLILSYVTRDSQGQPCSCFTFPNMFFLTGPRYFTFFKKKKLSPPTLCAIIGLSNDTNVKKLPQKIKKPKSSPSYFPWHIMTSFQLVLSESRVSIVGIQCFLQLTFYHLSLMWSVPR